jgi:hypothetical protein
VSAVTEAAPGVAGLPTPEPGSILRRLWRGAVPLGQAFWSFALLGGTALNLAATLIAMALLAMDGPGVLAALIFALPIPYNLLVLVAVWRSAGAYAGPRQWAELARVAIIVWAVVACVA